MSKRGDRTCYICGKKYNYCPSCGIDSNKPNWYFLTCSETCNEINEILSQHTAGRITDEVAKERLTKIHVENVDIIHEEDRQHVQQIMKTQAKVFENKENKHIDKNKNFANNLKANEISEINKSNNDKK